MTQINAHHDERGDEVVDPSRFAGSRRRALGTAAAGILAGAVAGMAGGAAIAASAVPPAAPVRIGARRFEDKTVVVTGGTSGIGRAAVRAFAAEGGRVGFCGRRDDRGAVVEAEVRQAGGEAFFVHADVREEEQVAAFVAAVVRRYGGLDVAFDNAGVSSERPLHTFDAGEWDRIMDTNVRGVFLAMKHQIPAMLASGGGTIVVTSSTAALASHPGRAVYSASKSALLGLVQGAALDYAAQGIRVNALLPGTTDTELVRRLAGMMDAPEAAWRIGAKQWAKSNVPGLQRMASADEVAAMALLLASDEFPYMTGSRMVLDGGRQAQG